MRLLPWLTLAFSLNVAPGAELFRVATWNLENYLDAPAGSRRAKSDEARTAIREMIQRMKPDVLALQEVGSTNAFMELRLTLDFVDSELVTGHDTNIHVAVLSRFPIVARRQHTNDSYLWPPPSREPRVCRSYHPTIAGLRIHFAHGAFEVPPACARGR